MKERQYKKLCKKAAEIVGGATEIEEGIHCFFWDCGGFEAEWDSEPAWDWLVRRFDGDVNTVIDEESECGISWAPKHLQVKATPKNVFSWARQSFK